MTGLVENGHLDEIPRQERKSSLQTTLDKVVITLDVHIAGEACAK